MATLFLSLSKNVSCTSTLQGKHLCQISWELVKNWGSSSRRKIGDRPPDRRHADSYIPPLYTTCMRGYNKTHWEIFNIYQNYTLVLICVGNAHHSCWQVMHVYCLSSQCYYLLETIADESCTKVNEDVSKDNATLPDLATTATKKTVPENLVIFLFVTILPHKVCN